MVYVLFLRTAVPQELHGFSLSQSELLLVIPPWSLCETRGNCVESRCVGLWNILEREGFRPGLRSSTEGGGSADSIKESDVWQNRQASSHLTGCVGLFNNQSNDCLSAMRTFTRAVSQTERAAHVTVRESHGGTPNTSLTALPAGPGLEKHAWRDFRDLFILNFNLHFLF